MAYIHITKDRARWDVGTILEPQEVKTWMIKRYDPTPGLFLMDTKISTLCYWDTIYITPWELPVYIMEPVGEYIDLSKTLEVISATEDAWLKELGRIYTDEVLTQYLSTEGTKVIEDISKIIHKFGTYYNRFVYESTDEWKDYFWESPAWKAEYFDWDVIDFVNAWKDGILPSWLDVADTMEKYAHKPLIEYIYEACEED